MFTFINANKSMLAMAEEGELGGRLQNSTQDWVRSLLLNKIERVISNKFYAFNLNLNSI